MDAKKLTRERFGKYAEGYVTSASHAGGPDLERLVELVGERPTWEALDVATGGGHTALAVAPHVARVVATDLTPAMLAAARDFILGQAVLNVEFRQADAEALSFPDANFDLVTCRIAAHHFPHPERFLRETRRVLRPGGLFLLQDQVAPPEAAAALYVNDFERRRDPSHLRAFSEEEWKKALAAAGLHLETVDRFEKRVVLEPWVDRQGGIAQDLADLRALLAQAPPEAQKWMHPSDLQSIGLQGPRAAFVIHHCLFSATKPGRPA
jgi:ubiquinone/menaquinone biosynthesis C-methylase UbiE